MSKVVIPQKDGSNITITSTDKNQVIRPGYDPENDIVKKHEAIVMPVVDIDLGIEECIKIANDEQ